MTTADSAPDPGPRSAAGPSGSDSFLAMVDHVDELFDGWWDLLRGHPLVDRIYYTASEAADFSLLWHTLGVIEAIIDDDPMVAVKVSAALGIESALINGPVKSLFRRNRPVHIADRPHHLRQPKTSSFPSGHASAAMVAAAMLSGPRQHEGLVCAGGPGGHEPHSRAHSPCLRCGGWLGGRCGLGGGGPTDSAEVMPS